MAYVNHAHMARSLRLIPSRRRELRTDVVGPASASHVTRRGLPPINQPILYTSMTHPERKSVDAMSAGAPASRHDIKPDTTQNGRHANHSVQAGTNWGWAHDTLNYDWMDSHAPFIDRS
jgi:hypothetical protein